MSLLTKRGAAAQETTRGSTRSSSAARTGGFQYKKRTAEQVRALANRSIGSQDQMLETDAPFFTPRAGDNTIRILPPPPDSDWGHYGVMLSVHYDIGPDKSKFLCLDGMKGEACPICEERLRASNADEVELAKELRPGQRVIMYVIDRAQENKGPMIWNLPAGLDKDITKLIIHPKSGEVLDVDDPNDGYDLTFTREGEKLMTKYKGVQFDRRPSPLSEDPDQAGQWLDYIVEHPLDKALHFETYDYISKVFSGQPPASSGADGASEEAPAARPRQAASEDKPSGSASTLRKRGAAAKEAPAGDEPETQGNKDAAGDVPSWADLEDMDDVALSELADEFKLVAPKDGFDSEDAIREWVADELKIERPKPEVKKEAKPAAGGGSWRDRLKNRG